MNNNQKWRNFQIEAFKHKVILDPKCAGKTWKILEFAIHDYNHNASGLSYEELYRRSPILSDLVPTMFDDGKVIDGTRLTYLFEKELKNSDVSPLRRMVLPKRGAEECLPSLDAKDGIHLTMDDMDGQHVRKFKFRILMYILRMLKASNSLIAAL